MVAVRSGDGPAGKKFARTAGAGPLPHRGKHPVVRGRPVEMPCDLMAVSACRAPAIDGHPSIASQPGFDLTLGMMQRRGLQVVVTGFVVQPGDFAFDLRVGLAEYHLDRFVRVTCRHSRSPVHAAFFSGAREEGAQTGRGPSGRSRIGPVWSRHCRRFCQADLADAAARMPAGSSGLRVTLQRLSQPSPGRAIAPARATGHGPRSCHPRRCAVAQKPSRLSDR
jgi:hypothetical protein